MSNRDIMRRNHMGHGYEPLAQGDAMEQLNEEMATQLKNKIGELKSLSIDIGQEVKYQDRLLRDMDQDFERTGGFLQNTMGRVMRLAGGSHNYFMLYIFLFSLFVFFVLYVVIKFR
ncbi:BET1 homolog isoform X1 [Nilaparvata lugens]|uniref:BET1 homolog isoform X1 n=2 Tax=Nilaparvata lugens TaxID=108931 RepID=UPI000B98EFFC|nr:BET1 homolog isoform X1 [Nilaparvata lugens]